MAKPSASRELSPPPRPLSRWRAAWRVLCGEPLVPEQILQDWLSYRLLFDDLLKRFSALLARQAKADHARLREQLQEEPVHRQPASSPRSRKEEVRRRAAEARGLSAFRAPVLHPVSPPLNHHAPRLEPSMFDELPPEELEPEEESP